MVMALLSAAEGYTDWPDVSWFRSAWLVSQVTRPAPRAEPSTSERLCEPAPEPVPDLVPHLVPEPVPELVPVLEDF